MEVKLVGEYKPLFVTPDCVLWANGYQIFVSDRVDTAARFCCNIPLGFILVFFSRIRVFSRVLRLEVFPVGIVARGIFLVSTKGFIWCIDTNARSVSLSFRLRASVRTLNCVTISASEKYGKSIWFGEYFFNPNKLSVDVYSFDCASRVWSRRHTFPQGSINHVHGVFYDRRSDSVWIATGDDDTSCGIWLVKPSGGISDQGLSFGQDNRIAWMVWRGENFVSATDTPLARNYLFKVRKNGNFGEPNRTYIASLPSSSIYFCADFNDIYFSTAYEIEPISRSRIFSLFSYRPAPGVLSDFVSVFKYSEQGDFKCLLSLRRSFMPPTIGQFPTFQFPVYEGEVNGLLVYCVAVRRFDGRAILIK